MRIPKNTTYIKAYALINMNCANKGDLIHFLKKSDGWHLENDRTGDSYSATLNHARNDKIFQIVGMI